MQRGVLRIGFWSALIAFVAGAGYSVVQVLQVLRILVWPTDAILIYAFSFCIAWPFLLAMLALHHSTPDEKKFWSHAGLLFAVMYAGYVTLIYALQLGTAIPLALRGTPNVFLVVDRYSLFWTLDAMGYICMGLATLFAAPVFAASEKWPRRFFVANGLFTAVITFVYFYPTFSIPLLLLATPWIITGPGSLLLLAVCFACRRRALRAAVPT